MKHCNALYIILSLLVPFFYSFGMEQPKISNEKLTSLIGTIETQQDVLGYKKPNRPLDSPKYFQEMLRRIKELEASLKLDPNNQKILELKQWYETNLEKEATACINMIVSDILFINQRIQERFHDQSEYFLRQTIKHNEAILKQYNLFDYYQTMIHPEEQKKESMGKSEITQSLVVRKQEKEKKEEELELLKKIIEYHPEQNPNMDFSVYTPQYFNDMFKAIEIAIKTENFQLAENFQVIEALNTTAINYINHVADNRKNSIDDKYALIKERFKDNTLLYLEKTWQNNQPTMIITTIPQEKLPSEGTVYAEEVSSEEEVIPEKTTTIMEQPLSKITTTGTSTTQPTSQPRTQPAQPEEQPIGLLAWAWQKITNFVNTTYYFFSWIYTEIFGERV